MSNYMAKIHSFGPVIKKLIEKSVLLIYLPRTPGVLPYTSGSNGYLIIDDIDYNVLSCFLNKTFTFTFAFKKSLSAMKGNNNTFQLVYHSFQ